MKSLEFVPHSRWIWGVWKTVFLCGNFPHINNSDNLLQRPYSPNLLPKSVFRLETFDSKQSFGIIRFISSNWKVFVYWLWTDSFGDLFIYLTVAGHAMNLDSRVWKSFWFGWHHILWGNLSGHARINLILIFSFWTEKLYDIIDYRHC